MRRFESVSSINDKYSPGETLRKRPLLYTDGAGAGKGLYQKGENMFNHYYAKQEQYKDFIKDAEKERIIKEIRQAEKEKKSKSSQNEDWAPGSLIEKLGLIFNSSQQISPELPK